MAPSKPSGKGPTPSKHSKAPTKTGPKPGSSKVKKAAPAVKTVQQKTKSTKLGQKKKRRVYTEKELNIPKLNSIVPAGIQKPNGMKKGKTFVDDKETMMTILAMVQAEKEGNIESKMMRARQMEEIREARKAEQEKRDMSKKKKLVRFPPVFRQ